MNATHPATVLVVDDDRLSAERTAALVAAHGHHPIVANSWSDALQSFLSSEIDLVLMDAVMPTVDGFKLTRIIRERARSYVPIVFLTGLRDEQARRRSVDAGADDLLTKPVHPVELQMRLVAMLRIRRLTRTLEDANAKLEQLARFDALTGLLNRRVYDEQLPKEIGRAQRYGRELCFLMIDVDHFKRVNDEHGHDAGDRVLACLGKVLRENLRASDQGFRYGGEELVIIAPETDIAGARVLAERLRARAHEATAHASSAGAQTLSIGVATLSALPKAAGPRELHGAADEALYRAKRTGRDRVVVYEPP